MSEAGPRRAYTPSAPRGQSEGRVQQTKETSPAAERSRRRPPRRRSDEPIRIPETRRRAPRTRTVKLQEVLKAYQQVIIDAVDERMSTVRDLGERLDRLEGAVRRLEGIAQAVDRLSADHRATVAEIGRRTGEGVVAVAGVLREDLKALRTELAGIRGATEPSGT